MRSVYDVMLHHPNYPVLHGLQRIFVTDHPPHSAGGRSCFCFADNMGCSRDYWASHEEAIRLFAMEHGAKVVSVVGVENP